MKRSAFTLVELLIVAVVLSLLVALLIPAINQARTSARTAQCITRQRDLALAMITYNNENNGLPGYLNELGETPIHSWAVAIFPMIGEIKRYEVLMNLQNGEPPSSDVVVSLPALICPADNPDGDGRLNYVVNCGPVEEDKIDGDTAPALTLFKDRRFDDPKPPKSKLTSINRKVKIEDIPDGMSNTILLSENLDAGFWHKYTDKAHPVKDLDFGWYAWTDDEDNERKIPDGDRELQRPPSGGGEYTRDKVSVDSLGFIWSSNKDSQYVPNAPAPPGAKRVARPSSNHPGVVVAAYADGAARKVNDDISLTEWLNAVCPDDEKLKELLE